MASFGNRSKETLATAHEDLQKVANEVITYNYITTNLINGKQYVGMHSTNNVDDGYLGTGKLILKAIKKYGKDNFKREIICKCETIDKAYDNEEKFIKQHNTLQPNGYNISPKGGLGYKGCHSEETKEKMRGPRKPFSEETKKRMSKFHIGLKESLETRNKKRMFGKRNPRFGKVGLFKGKRHTEETKQINRIKHLGNKHTEETKLLMSEQRKGIKKNHKEVECPHCNLVGRGPNMTRYHFKNCKHATL